MRLRIKFALSGKKQILPLNYNYAISTWIYKVVARADEDFAKELHDRGYRLQSGKTFKLFTFSRLMFPQKSWNIIPRSDRMEIRARNARLTLSFYLPVQTGKFIVGLFQEQEVAIGDKISRVKMRVEMAESVKQVSFANGKIQYRAVTPLVITRTSGEFRQEQYLSPLDDDFEKRFASNLLDKYRAACIFTGKQPEHYTLADIKISNLTPHPRSALQRIKAYTAEETSVKGYLFDFELTAPADLHETGFNAGFGAMSSLGFGFCEVISNDF